MQIINSPYKVVKKCTMLLLGLFTMAQVAFSQVTVTISDDATNPGGTVDMDVTFDNFTDIIAFQYSINWDPTKFEFNELKNITSDLDQFTAGLISTPAQTGDEGVIQVSWSKSNAQPETLANGTRIFTLSLTAIGDACDISDVRLSNTPTEIEFADENANDVGAIAMNGEATINGTNCSGGDGDLIVTIDNVTADAGSNRCVPVRVENFVDIQVVGFGIEFDPTIIRYTGFQNANLPDFSGGNMNEGEADQGRLTLAWFDNTAVNPVSLEGTLIEFCFDAIGAGGEVSDIEMVAPSNSEIDFTNADEMSVPYELNQGSFAITGMIDPNAFTLIAGDVNVPMGQVGCVPISVRNFDNIQTMQFVMRWNANALMYSEVTSLNLDQLTQENITTKDDDKIRVSWNNPNSATVPDGTVIFELCLEALGDCDNATNVSFTSEPFFAIEVSNSSNELVDVATVSGAFNIACDGCSIAIRSLENPSCPGEADGNILVTLGNPSATYNCIWRDETNTIIQESSSCDLMGVEAGTYTLLIDDGADCQISRAFTLEGPGNIIFGGSKINETESCDGSINLMMMGGTAPFSFVWDDGNTDATRTELCAGEYCVTATDANGCAEETCFTIQAGGPTPCGIDITNVRCNGDNDGAIELCIEGGTGPYTVQWSGPSGEFNTEDISGLLAGTYNYTITDSSDPAISSQGSVVVEEPDMITISEIVTNSDGDNGAIDISVAGGVGPYSYLWSPGGATTEDISGLGVGTYTVMITDDNNCSENFDIDVLSTSIMIAFDDLSASCNNVCDGTISGSVTNGEAPYTFTLDGNAVTFPITDLCPGDYTLVVTDAAGTSVSQPVTIRNPEPLVVETTEVVNCTEGEMNGRISVEVTGGTEDYSFNWSRTGNGPQISGLGGGVYNVVVTDARGCTATLANAVQLSCGGGECFSSRSVITPNGDALNNEFVIMCATDFPNKLIIFDRWGRTVFSQDDYANDWEGTDNAGEQLPDGGYLWVMEITNGDGSKEIYRGSVTVIRDQF